MMTSTKIINSLAADSSAKLLLSRHEHFYRVQVARLLALVCHQRCWPLGASNDTSAYSLLVAPPPPPLHVGRAIDSGERSSSARPRSVRDRLAWLFAILTSARSCQNLLLFAIALSPFGERKELSAYLQATPAYNCNYANASARDSICLL